jgi:transcriptional regulator with XRE-family HTH domain
MEIQNPGSYLAEHRRRKRKSLQHIASRMGRGSFSKQALSLIERGRMRIPKLRVKGLHNAYGLSMQERKELSLLYSFERLIEDTGEDREFAEAILSVMNPSRANSVYVIGGRQLAINSRLLQEKAAAFLDRASNQLIFLYPECEKAHDTCRKVWGSNARRDSLLLRRSIETLSGHRLQERIQFRRIDVHEFGADTLTLNILSLCSPVTSTTIACSISSDYVVGYVYVEGPRDRWVLLKHGEARRLLEMITSWLAQKRDGESHSRD